MHAYVYRVYLFVKNSIKAYSMSVLFWLNVSQENEMSLHNHRLRICDTISNSSLHFVSQGLYIYQLQEVEFRPTMRGCGSLTAKASG